MLFLGWYKEEFYSTRPKNIDCPNCGVKSQTIVKGYVNGWNVFFIPIFPYRLSHVFECVSCRSEVEFREMDKKTKKKYGLYRVKRFPPFWHFSGLLLIGSLLIWNIISGYQEKAKLHLKVEAIETGQIIELKNKESEYTTLKVYGVTDKLIFAGYNLYQADRKSGLSKIHQTKNYSNDTVAIERTILEDWSKNNKIIDVFR